MKLHRLLLFFATQLIGLCLACGAPSWVRSTPSLGSLAMDGTLAKRFSLGTLRGSPEFHLPLTLEHSLSPYPHGEWPTYSLWQVPQLVSYVAPGPGNSLLWVAPGGQETLFRGNRKPHQILSAKPAKLPFGWTAIRSRGAPAGTVDIVSHDGWTYHYREGELQWLESPAKRRLWFKTDLIYITAIEQRTPQGTVILLEAGFDDLGRLSDLRIGPDYHLFTYPDDSEQLGAWTPFGLAERTVTFFYNDHGIVERIVYPRGPDDTYVWCYDKKAYPDDQGLEIPMRQLPPFLLSDQRYQYRFGTRGDGHHLVRINKLGHQDSLIVNPFTNRLTLVDRGGVRSTLAWNTMGASRGGGRLQSVIGPEGVPHVFLEYDERDFVVKARPRGQKPYLYEYDDSGRLLSFSREGLPPTVYQYEGESERPVRITNPLGRSVAFSYYEDGQIRRYRDLGGHDYEFYYDSLGRLIRRSFPMDLTLALRYDAFGRVIEYVAPNGRKTEITYNDFNQVSKVNDAEILWSYEYEPNGRLSAVFRNGRPWHRWERSRDEDGNETLVMNDALGRESRRRYDLEGKLLAEISPLNEEITFDYDPIGQLAGWQDPAGGAVRFDYDERGAMVLQENVLGQKLERKFDDFGRIEARITDEQSTGMRYDEAGRVVRIQFGPDENLDYSYDDYGRIREIRSGELVTQMVYDRVDRLTGRQTSHLDGSTSRLLYEYDEAGRRSRILLRRLDEKGGESETLDTRYERDALGRVRSVSVNGVPQVKWEYDYPNLLLSAKVFANGISLRYHYDPYDRLRRVITLGKEGELLQEVTYEWNEHGQLLNRGLRQGESSGGLAHLPPESESFSTTTQ